MLSDKSAPEFIAGQRVNLGVEMEDELRWFSSRLEAHAREDSRVTVMWPKEEGALVPVKVGQATLLEAGSSDDALYTIEMIVEHAFETGEPAITLMPASPWRRMQRRQDVRVHVIITPTVAEVMTDEGWDTLKGTVRNVSAGGLMFRSESELKEDQRLDLGFALPPAHTGHETPGHPAKKQPPQEVRVRVDVRRVEHVERGNAFFWEAGCQYAGELKPQDRDRIIRFVFEQQRAAARRQRGL